jgi:hypothetical protein
MKLYIISNSYTKIKVISKTHKNQLVKIYINCKETLPGVIYYRVIYYRVNLAFHNVMVNQGLCIFFSNSSVQNKKNEKEK